MNSGNLMAEFARVDRMANPRLFVRSVDTMNAMEQMQQVKRQNFALLDVQPGHRVLDVGCGTGDDVRTLARLAGPGGLVVGIDNSQTMIAEARLRGIGLGSAVEYRIGDAHRLDVEARSFDRCRAERLLQHLDDPRQALQEMARVVRPGGRIVISDTDWGLQAVDASDQALTRRLLAFQCDGYRHGWIGRQLPALFKEAGLREITIVPHTLLFTTFARQPLQAFVAGAQQAGVVSTEEATAWLDDLEQRAAGGCFLTSVVMFTVAGRTAGSAAAD